jgi:arylsulfatase A-like enzyme
MDDAPDVWLKPWYDLWPKMGAESQEDRSWWKRQEARGKAFHAANQRLNVLFIFTDQQTLNAMSCAGNRWCNTPHLDALATRGVRFTKSFCTGPVCGPSRSSLVTSRMPHETGVVFNGQSPDQAIPNLGQIFRAAGYTTLWAGKWHLPDSYPKGREDIPGFDNLAVPFGARGRAGGLGDHTDAYIASDAEFLLRWDLAKVGKPWLLAISLHNPHDICEWITRPPLPHANLDRYPPLPANAGPSRDEAAFVAAARATGSSGKEITSSAAWDDAQWRAYLAAYYHMTEQVDRCVGRILQALADGGWAERTLVVFTSDHGEGCAAHRWVAKNSFYEESIQVPFLISLPGRIPQGRVEERALVSGLDVLPTICDYAGVAAPAVVRGRSLRAVIEDPAVDGRTAVVAEVAHRERVSKAERFGRMVRTADWKYTCYSDGSQELYELREDPGEMRNRINEPVAQSVIVAHRQHLRAWAAMTNDAAALSILDTVEH